MNITNKVIVTGGTGFVGHWMKETQPKGYDAVYLSQSVYDAIPFQDWQGYSVVHLAPTDPARAIQAARHTRLLYCSSGIVNHPENDIPYRRDKMHWEADCLASGVDCVIARLYAFAESSKAWRAFDQAARYSEPIIITGDGRTVRTFMHGYELGFWMWKILERGVNGEAYDVGDEKPVTMIELAWEMIHKYNQSSQIVIQGGTDPMPYYVPDMTKTKGLL